MSWVMALALPSSTRATTISPSTSVVTTPVSGAEGSVMAPNATRAPRAAARRPAGSGRPRPVWRQRNMPVFGRKAEAITCWSKPAGAWPVVAYR